jgi:hypothetical protein
MNTLRPPALNIASKTSLFFNLFSSVIS